MTKYTKAFTAIRQIIRNPWLLNKVLDDEAYWRNKVKAYDGSENGFSVISATDLFGDFNESVMPFSFLEGGSLPTDLALLKKLARMKSHCSYFEIGTWRGESVANVARVARECFTLNLSSEEMQMLGMPQGYIDQHRFFSNDLQNVTHLEGNSKNFDFSGLNRKFDLIFIDGDHHYEMVKSDTEKVFRHLVDEHSIVVWHDYAHNPAQVRYEVMAGILDGTPGSLHHNLFHISNTLCVVCIPGYKPDRLIDTSAQPAGYFKIDLSFMKK